MPPEMAGQTAARLDRLDRSDLKVLSAPEDQADQLARQLRKVNRAFPAHLSDQAHLLARLALSGQERLCFPARLLALLALLIPVWKLVHQLALLVPLALPDQAQWKILPASRPAPAVRSALVWLNLSRPVPVVQLDRSGQGDLQVQQHPAAQLAPMGMSWSMKGHPDSWNPPPETSQLAPETTI